MISVRAGSKRLAGRITNFVLVIVWGSYNYIRTYALAATSTYRKRELSLPDLPVFKRELSLLDLPVLKRELSLPDLPVLKRELSLPDLPSLKRELSLPDLPV